VTTSPPKSVFVVESYCDSEAGDLVGAFSSMADALEHCDQLVATANRATSEFEITRCAPEPREIWRRLVDDGRWSSEWEHVR